MNGLLRMGAFWRSRPTNRTRLTALAWRPRILSQKGTLNVSRFHASIRHEHRNARTWTATSGASSVRASLPSATSVGDATGIQPAQDFNRVDRPTEFVAIAQLLD